MCIGVGYIDFVFFWYFGVVSDINSIVRVLFGFNFSFFGFFNGDFKFFWGGSSMRINGEFSWGVGIIFFEIWVISFNFVGRVG